MTDSDRESKVAAIVQKLDKTSGSDILATAFRAAVDAIPIVGGSLSTLVDQMIPDWKLKRLLTFVAELALDIESLQDKLDKDYIKTEEFGYIFEQTFRAVLQEHQNEKLQALKNVLLNSMVRKDVNQEMKEYMLNTLRKLDSIHMRFIGLLDNPAAYYKTKALSDGSPIPGGSMINEMRRCFPELNESVIRAVWNDLFTYGITNTDANSLGGMISTSGSKALESRLSQFGRLLVDFAKSPART
jgi:hypothetical protein